MKSSKQQQLKKQVEKSELEGYLLDNPFKPIYVVTKKDEIAMSIVFDGDKFVGSNYKQADEQGNPYLVEIPCEKYSRLLKRITDKYTLYTSHGMKLVLDSWDRTSPV